MGYNYKLIAFCQRCNKEHDRTNDSMFERPVKCDYCTGFVVAPSGRSIVEVRMIANIYMVVGANKTAWIGADNELDAKEMFVGSVERELRECHKMKKQMMQEPIFLINPFNTGNEEDNILVDGNSMISMSDTLPVMYHVFDNELIKTEIRNKKREDEGESL